MENTINIVNKYKQRLYPSNDFKKILHALQKLNEVEMTVDILRKTEIGKAVNKLKRLDGIGSFSKEIVIKWKKLLEIPKYVPAEPALDYKNSTESDAVKEEYDPSQNWEMKKQKKKKEQKRETEYDPSQNWKMKMANSTKEGTVNDSLSDASESPRHNSKRRKKKKTRYLFPDANETPPSSIIQADVDAMHYEDDSLEKPSDVEASDNDYPSSREESPPHGDVGDYSLDVDSYTPSTVTSETVSCKNHSPDHSEYYDDRPKTSKTFNAINNHRTSSKHDRLRLKQPDVIEKPKKIKTEKSFKKPENVSSESSVLVHAKSKESKNLHGKRKATTSDSTKPVKKRKTEEKITKVSKTSKPTRQNSADMSFEQFMMMDTTKVNKKKKKPKQNQKTMPKMKPNASKPEVKLHLPEIKSTYHPLPVVQPRGRHQLANAQSQMTDELAAALHTQRNSKKMQVYSGNKGNFLPKMMSLYDQCMNVLLNNIDSLDVIGVPYDIIKPVLERCTVEQLYRLEDANHYLLVDTSELWKKHAHLDFRSHQPEEMESWREMYLRLYDAREEKLAKLTQSIQAKVNKAKPLEKRTKLAYVGIGQAKAPRNVLRAQLKYGTAGKKPIPYAPRSSSKSSSSSSASDLKQRVADIRMSVPVGTITASTVDEMASNSRNSNMKKQPPRMAPMMAKTLKSINKIRYRR